MCLFHMHFWQENALQCNMVVVCFSPRTVSRHAVKWHYPYEHALPLWARAFFVREQWKMQLTLEQSRIVYRRAGCIWAVLWGSSQGLRCRFDGTWKQFFFFLLTSRNNCFDAQTDISQRDKVLFFFVATSCHLTENSRRAFMMLVTKIQRLKILKWKKKWSINNKKKTKKRKTPASRDENMTPACAFLMNQSVGTGNTHWGKGSHTGVSRTL